MPPSTYSTRLASALAINKTTQQQLADSIGRDQSTISHWINGKKTPSAETIALVAKTLGVRSAWLAFGDGAMTETADAPPPTPPTPKRRTIPPPAAPPASKRPTVSKKAARASKPGPARTKPRSSALPDDMARAS